ncbi:transposase [Pseudonocardia xinjiangensis]|uniref:transposase n=1 Tax=Pseudonocardia xinjiangensis TaxID=75289 RepID=UPI003D901BC0
MGRGELTDKAWTRIEPLLPPVESGGRRWRDHRQVINAILWKLRTGAPWRDLPERYGPWKPPTSGCGSGPRTAPGNASSTT